MSVAKYVLVPYDQYQRMKLGNVAPSGKNLPEINQENQSLSTQNKPIKKKVSVEQKKKIKSILEKAKGKRKYDDFIRKNSKNKILPRPPGEPFQTGTGEKSRLLPGGKLDTKSRITNKELFNFKSPVKSVKNSGYKSVNEFLKKHWIE